MKVHYIYKITFLKGNLNGHYYIGKRTTELSRKKFEWSGFDNIDEWMKNDPMFDNYTGSGRIPIDYFKKYGKKFGETFRKEILLFSKTFQENRLNEEKIIGDRYKTDELCVNLVRGGMCENPRSGKDSYTYKRVISKEMREHLSKINKERCKTTPMPWKGKKKTEKEKKEISEKMKEYFKTHEHPNKGRKHTEETIKLCSEIEKEKWKDPKYREHVLNGIRNFHKEHPNAWSGRTMSNETKEKLSLRFKGVPNPKNKGELNGMYGKKPPNIRKIIQFDKDGTQIKVWDSIKDASESLNIASANIIKVCKGERKTCCNYVWKYA